MSILLFIGILIVLILVHEFGHFIVAKKSGIRVDEFGIGFPPKIWGKKFGETEYTINALPFGGFVRIFGESPDDESMSGSDSKRSFTNQSKIKQTAVIAAGVIFNFILGWILISTSYMIGLPSTVEGAPEGVVVENVELTISGVLPGSPAEEAGLSVGQSIESLSVGSDILADPTIESVQKFVNLHANEEIIIEYTFGKNIKEKVTVIPEEGIVEGVYAVGIAMDAIGTVSLPVHRALWEGGKLTIDVTVATFLGLKDFFTNIFIGNADFSEISGPVGIVSIVDDASTLGFVYLLTLTAIISINLGLINLIPFPALDGGRLLFLLIETIKRSPIKPAVANAMNMIGFVALILLMVVITYNDIAKITTG